jgi:hypothetical protein
MPFLWKLATDVKLPEIISGFLSCMLDQTLEEANAETMVPAYDPEALRELFERAESAPAGSNENFAQRRPVLVPRSWCRFDSDKREHSVR